MSVPNTRESFKYYCLRRLGLEVVNVNVSDNQVEDRIDEALLMWQDFNSDATFRQLYKYQVQGTDVTNQYIILPPNIIGAVGIYNVGDGMSMNNIFDIRYQISLNDLYTLTSVSMVPYYMAFQHIELLEQLLVGLKPIRYNRIANTLYIDMDWSTLVGNYFLVDSYATVDPATYPKVWADRMLQRYATVLIKEQWGSNLKKFGNMQMPGGITFNGQAIYDEAIKERADVEDQMRRIYEKPPEPFFG